MLNSNVLFKNEKNLIKFFFINLKKILRCVKKFEYRFKSLFSLVLIMNFKSFFKGLRSTCSQTLNVYNIAIYVHNLRKSFFSTTFRLLFNFSSSSLSLNYYESI